MPFSVGDKINGFEVVKVGHIAERQTDAYEMRHTASGARLLYLANDDQDKAFSISFKTPPKDDTGVFHILEHSVLCGSRKFNLKEPFVHLIKTSMATFINAMTFPDKTMYPVSSTNQQDLINLMDVYMDAVLFPNIYKNPNIFYQEGGHKTVDSQNNLGFNGVVYNEMCGAYTDPSEVVSRSICKDLFPNTCYGYESGGYPDAIMDLTYHEFLNEHRAHYRLDNSYIVLYGDLDCQVFLEFLDKNYLSCNQEIENWRNGNQLNCDDLTPRNIQQQKPTVNTHKTIDMNTTKDKKTCALAYVVDSDKLTKYATNILIESIASSNETPLKEKLLKLGKCQDITFSLHDDLQPTLWVECKQPIQGFGESLKDEISEAVKQIITDGIDPDQIRASINKQLFTLNENLAYTTHGIDAAMEVMTQWLHNDNESFDALYYQDILEQLKNLANTNYFNDLAREIFIDNKHYASCEINCIDSKAAKNYGKLNDKSEIDNINKLCDDLEKSQNQPDSQKDIDSLPTLSIQDIDKSKDEPELKIEEIDGLKHLVVDTKSQSISYLSLCYDCNHLSIEDLPYVSLLSIILGRIDTKSWTAKDIDIYTNTNLGNLTFSATAFPDFFDKTKYSLKYVVSGSCLNENIDYLLEAIKEIILNTKFEQKDKIKALLIQQQVAMTQSISNAGHANVIERSLSYINAYKKINQKLSGIDFYMFLTDLLKDYDKQYDNMINKISALYKSIFSSSYFIVSNLDNNTASQFSQLQNEACKNINNASYKYFENVPAVDLQEAFVVPGNVGYAGMAINLVTDSTNSSNTNPTKLNAAGQIAPTLISYDYLWNEIRIKGGAYGAGYISAMRDQYVFYTFRDPNPNNSFKEFQKASGWLSKTINENKYQQSDLEKAIISTIAKFDSPKNDRQIISRAITDAITGSNKQYRKDLRLLVLKCSFEDIKSYCDIAEKAAKKAPICLIGSFDQCSQSGLNVIDLFSI